MVGETISHYKVTAEVGRGGMGVVYKAEDTSLERPVALKFLAPHLVEDTEIRKRFEREAKAAAALNHPNVCTVHEIAEANARPSSPWPSSKASRWRRRSRPVRSS